MRMRHRAYRIVLGSLVGMLARGCGGDDGRNAIDLDAGAPSADASVDAGTTQADAAPASDASSSTKVPDASSNGDASIDMARDCQPLEQPLSFGDEGGLMQSTVSSQVTRQGSYIRTRTTDGHDTSCTAPLARCGSDGVSLAELTRALANADVVAAFASAQPNAETVYGVDSRPVDGSILVISQGPKKIGVGGPCSAGGSCVAIPAGVDALATLLRRLNSEQHESGPCADSTN